MNIVVTANGKLRAANGNDQLTRQLAAENGLTWHKHHTRNGQVEVSGHLRERGRSALEASVSTRGSGDSERGRVEAYEADTHRTDGRGGRVKRQVQARNSHKGGKRAYKSRKSNKGKRGRKSKRKVERESFAGVAERFDEHDVDSGSRGRRREQRELEDIELDLDVDIDIDFEDSDLDGLGDLTDDDDELLAELTGDDDFDLDNVDNDVDTFLDTHATGGDSRSARKLTRQAEEKLLLAERQMQSGLAGNAETLAKGMRNLDQSLSLEVKAVDRQIEDEQRSAESATGELRQARLAKVRKLVTYRDQLKEIIGLFSRAVPRRIGERFAANEALAAIESVLGTREQAILERERIALDRAPEPGAARDDETDDGAGIAAQDTASDDDLASGSDSDDLKRAAAAAAHDSAGVSDTQELINRAGISTEHTIDNFRAWYEAATTAMQNNDIRGAQAYIEQADQMESSIRSMKLTGRFWNFLRPFRSISARMRIKDYEVVRKHIDNAMRELTEHLGDQNVAATDDPAMVGGAGSDSDGSSRAKPVGASAQSTNSAASGAGVDQAKVDATVQTMIAAANKGQNPAVAIPQGMSQEEASQALQVFMRTAEPRLQGMNTQGIDQHFASKKVRTMEDALKAIQTLKPEVASQADAKFLIAITQLQQMLSTPPPGPNAPAK